MKKILLLLFTLFYLAPALTAQDCDCGKVKFTITDWICKGKTPAGDPIYEGKLTIDNNTGCKFALSEMFQQTPGDVTAPLPVSVPPNSTYSTTIVYADVPPHVSPGATPYFIVVYTLDDKKCKFEFPSDKIPACDLTCTCRDDGWVTFVATVGGISQKVECGHQFGILVNSKVEMDGKYICLGRCTAKYVATLIDNTTNTVVQSWNALIFPWQYTFNNIGNFRLQKTPICGDKKCTPCVYYFTVRRPVS